MTWGGEVQAEVARALADLSGAGLAGGSPTNAVLSRAVAGTYDPALGMAGGSISTWPCVAVVEEVRQRPQEGDLIARVSRRAVLSGLPTGIAPRDEDRLTVGTASWTVREVAAPQMTGQAASFVVELVT